MNNLMPLLDGRPSVGKNALLILMFLSACLFFTPSWASDYTCPAPHVTGWYVSSGPALSFYGLPPLPTTPFPTRDTAKSYINGRQYPPGGGGPYWAPNGPWDDRYYPSLSADLNASFQEYQYYTQDGTPWNGIGCCNISFTVQAHCDLVQYFASTTPSSSTNISDAGNTCPNGPMCGASVNPSTGGEYHTDTDLPAVAGSPLSSFTRYYNSLITTSNDLGPSWRHTYSRKVLTDPPAPTYVTNSPNNSALYSDAATACSSGWSDIKAQTGQPNTTATYSNNVCTVSLNSTPVMTVPYVNGNPMSNIDPSGLFLYPIHVSITKESLGNSNEFPGLPSQVGGADFLDGSQDPANSYWHAMSNGLINQPEWLAADLYDDYIDAQLSLCTQAGLARALHAVQDSAARGHKGFQRWTGGATPLHLPTLSHIEGDAYPTAEEKADAIQKSKEIMQRYKKACPCNKK